MFFLVNKAQKPKIKEKYQRLTLVHPLQKFQNLQHVQIFLNLFVVGSLAVRTL